MANGVWAKSAAELTEHDTQHVLWQLLQRIQRLEVNLADAVSLLLLSSGDAPTLSVAQYHEVVDRLTGYLEQTNQHLQQMLEIEARYRQEQE